MALSPLQWRRVGHHRWADRADNLRRRIAVEHPVPYEVTTGNSKQVSVTNGTNPPATTTVTIAATAPGFPLLTGRERGKLPPPTSAPPRRLTASTKARRRLKLAIRFCST